MAKARDFGESEFTKVFRELMEKYDEFRRLWIESEGTEEGFDEWFTKQVTGRQA